ncbi:hypothetical protein SADUNF_Sadunf16G0147900 [Salix dunnii]|uniref:Uncharacterized protein n=1 Tax=Salix dunnii TaxID=1413687 RepID=A0A835MH14_9ROSI|nr:hypothetical protein SADUNF_Sadunf16G0147900 [Salix dunnii]
MERKILIIVLTGASQPVCEAGKEMISNGRCLHKLLAGRRASQIKIMIDECVVTCILRMVMAFDVSPAPSHCPLELAFQLLFVALVTSGKCISGPEGGDMRWVVTIDGRRNRKCFDVDSKF